jgi:hypothetical protein
MAARIGRQEIIDALHGALKEADWVRAAWLGGSDASGRTDEYSDVDLCVVVEDDRVEDGFDLIRGAAERLSPIAHRFRMPEPAWHGLSQEFLSLADANPHHFLDYVVMKQSTPPEHRFLERERHGEALVLFDRDGFVTAPPMDREAHAKKMAARLPALREQFFLFQPLVTRGPARGHLAEAPVVYQSMTLRPLIEILRMRYCPDRYDYGPRYIDRDLPPEWRAEIERLAYPPDAPTLLEYQARAAAHVAAELEAFDAGEWSLPET